MFVPDSTEPLCCALLQAQERHQLFPSTPGDEARIVLVGVSGGADSVCLLHLLLRFAPLWNLALHVAHLDHNVRPDSAEDGAFVRELAANWDLPFHTRLLAQAEIDAADNNLEAGLRRLRYGFFADVAASLAGSASVAPTVAVAHTADDQAET
ncbi:MAG: tRNA lysidine(34) synthetase TilS, partial [Chloroflexi bacterium]|nr:tRNA lysidine(34) synthetase TilS [Chloroflexota bacterium]